jgi:hypothetical protein
MAGGQPARVEWRSGEPAVGLAMAQKPSVDFCGYWQRHFNYD